MNQQPPRDDRQPDPAYVGTNGYLTTFAPATTLTDPLDLEYASAKTQLAQFVINHQARRPPTMQEMRNCLDSLPPTTPAATSTTLVHSDSFESELAFIEEEIKTVQGDHIKDLETLFAIHSQEYLDEARSVELSRLMGVLDNGGEDKVANISSFDRLSPAFVSEYSHIRYAYLSKMTALQNARIQTRLAQAEEKRRQNAAFPRTAQEFEEKTNDIKLRVARFLTGTRAVKDKNIAEFGWVGLQVRPLELEFERGGPFRQQIEKLIKDEQAVRDPRRRM